MTHANEAQVPCVVEANLTTNVSVQRAADLIVKLRPDLTRQTSVQFVREAAGQGYRVLFCRLGRHKEVVGMAGFRVLASSRGRIVMLEDLVVTQAARTRGVGSCLLAHVRARAERAGCARVELDTAIANSAALRFYATQGFGPIAVHLASEVAPAT